MAEPTFTAIETIPDYRGTIKKIFTNSSEWEEIYVSTCYPGMYKGLHYHEENTMRFVCVHGSIDLWVLKDNNGIPEEDTPKFKVITMGDVVPGMVTIPPGHWIAWRAVGDKEAVVINFLDKPYDKDEMKSLPITAWEGYVKFEYEVSDSDVV